MSLFKSQSSQSPISTLPISTSRTKSKARGFRDNLKDMILRTRGSQQTEKFYASPKQQKSDRSIASFKPKHHPHRKLFKLQNDNKTNPLASPVSNLSPAQTCDRLSASPVSNLSPITTCDRLSEVNEDISLECVRVHRANITLRNTSQRISPEQQIISLLMEKFQCYNYTTLLQKVKEIEPYKKENISIQTQNEVQSVSTQTRKQENIVLPSRVEAVVRKATDNGIIIPQEPTRLDGILDVLEMLLDARQAPDQAVQQLTIAASNLQFIVNDKGVSQKIDPVQIFDATTAFVESLKKSSIHNQRELKLWHDFARRQKENLDKFERENRGLKQMVLNQKNEIIDLHLANNKLR